MSNKSKSEIFTYSFCLFLSVFIAGCESFDLPTEKTLKICVNPSGLTTSLTSQSGNHSLGFDISGNKTDVASVLWTTISSAQFKTTSNVNNTNKFTYWSGIDAVNVTAEIKNVCGGTTTLSAQMSPTLTFSNVSTTNIDNGTSIKIDNAGNIYYLYDYGVSSNNRDIYLTKTNENGNLIWTNKITSNGIETGNDLVLDGNGNVYIVGNFSNTIGFTTSGGTGTFKSISPIGADDFFIAKYDTNGSLVWVTKGGTINNDAANSIAVDASGNVFITGFYDTNFALNLLNANNNGQTQVPVSSTGLDIFVAKYDILGNCSWVRTEKSPKSSGAADVGNGIAIDNTGACYITGLSWAKVAENMGSNDTFVIKYSTDGVKQWDRAFGGGGNDIGIRIATDNKGFVYFTGLFEGNITSLGLTSSGSSDAFLAKIRASDGSLVWGRSVGGSADDISEDLAIDNVYDIIYCTGRFESKNIAFQSKTIANAGKQDIFIAKFKGDGTMFGFEGFGGGNNDFGKGIAINVITQRLVGIGNYESNFSVNNGTALSNTGNADVFVFQYYFR